MRCQENQNVCCLKEQNLVLGKRVGSCLLFHIYKRSLIFAYKKQALVHQNCFFFGQNLTRKWKFYDAKIGFQFSKCMGDYVTFHCHSRKKSPPNYFCFFAKTVLVVFAFSCFLRWHEVTSEGQREKTKSLALVPIEDFLIRASTLNDAN